MQPEYGNELGQRFNDRLYLDWMQSIRCRVTGFFGTSLSADKHNPISNEAAVRQSQSQDDQKV